MSKQSGMNKKKIILGAGVTGLAAGYASGLSVFEADDNPGGICSSYYIRPDSKEKLLQSPIDDEAYRFEIGGGHWIFGVDPALNHFLQKFSLMNTYTRRSSVYFNKENLYVPYPLQNNLRFFAKKISDRAIKEMSSSKGSFQTMKEWLNVCFGKTLCSLFFFPFHELYTSGLYDRIAPQDTYKSPVDLSLVINGSSDSVEQVGYNAMFGYPVDGLGELCKRIAAQCNVRYGKRVIRIDPSGKTIHFDDSNSISYDTLISTLPLNKMMEITGIKIDDVPDPYTSVLVLNIGAVKGNNCPKDHWLYTPDTRSGFHRVGFYSNVDKTFSPASSHKSKSRVCMYVEKAYQGGNKPSELEISLYCDSVIEELQNWNFIGDVEVADPTWIDVAYTWSWPDSTWKPTALKVLEKKNIYQVGRYGRWSFQGISDSIRDGFIFGLSMK